jgi:hypothetical protein
MFKEYGGYFVGLIWFVVVASVLLVAGNVIGSANHAADEQTHKQRMECLDRGGEIKYVTNVGTACVKD